MKAVFSYTPFLMMTDSGKVKPNITRFVEMAIFASIMVVILLRGVEEIKDDLKDIRGTQLELREDRAKTGERLGRLEQDVEEIKRVVFKPIKGYTK